MVFSVLNDPFKKGGLCKALGKLYKLIYRRVMMRKVENIIYSLIGKWNNFFVQRIVMQLSWGYPSARCGKLYIVTFNLKVVTFVAKIVKDNLVKPQGAGLRG